MYIFICDKQYDTYKEQIFESIFRTKYLILHKHIISLDIHIIIGKQDNGCFLI